MEGLEALELELEFLRSASTGPGRNKGILGLQAGAFGRAGSPMVSLNGTREARSKTQSTRKE